MPTTPILSPIPLKLQRSTLLGLTRELDVEMSYPNKRHNHETIQDPQYNINYSLTNQITGSMTTNHNSLTTVPAIHDDESVQVTLLPAPKLNGRDMNESTILPSYLKWPSTQQTIHNDWKACTDATSVELSSGMSIPYTQIQHTHIKNKV
jgi:hypothetical protein